MTAPLPAGCNQLGPDFAAMLRSVALLNVRRAFGGPLVEVVTLAGILSPCPR